MIIKKGSTVTLEYKGTFDDGTVFDSSQHEDHSHPLTFVVGKGMVIQGFENVVEGMSLGEEKKFSVSPEEGYGLPDERLLREVPRNVLPSDPAPAVGMTLQLNTPAGERVPVRVASVGNETVTLDFNHLLAGKKLFFKIKVLEINNSGE